MAQASPHRRRPRGRVLLGAAAAAGALVAAGVWTHVADSALVRADPDTALSARAEARALAAGQEVFAGHCAACHGRGGTGAGVVSAPDLTDADWLYGDGKVSEIEQVIAYGVRSGYPKGWNLAVMPAFAKGQGRYKVEALSPAETRDLVAFLRKAGGRSADGDAAARGESLFGGKGGCFDCHGADAKGDAAIGAPNLVDAVWLYGGRDEQVFASIAEGRRGVMPAFAGRLDALQLRQVSLYVHSLSDRVREARR